MNQATVRSVARAAMFALSMAMTGAEARAEAVSLLPAQLQRIAASFSCMVLTPQQVCTRTPDASQLPPIIPTPLPPFVPTPYPNEGKSK